ncbi:hypothetical protein PGIGA_G00048340 [Pangasianodon gigas]|uniref:Uncharacterized protein n=1 Tax=Pangasianodon gigas TaxID=30993 RepID=A0ACC5X1U0_PANGG|nr:hypothetical protein [Pangasianodon gigas]
MSGKKTKAIFNCMVAVQRFLPADYSACTSSTTDTLSLSSSDPDLTSPDRIPLFSGLPQQQSAGIAKDV